MVGTSNQSDPESWPLNKSPLYHQSTEFMMNNDSLLMNGSY